MTSLQFQLGGTLKFVVEEDTTPTIAAMLTVEYEGFKLTARGDVMYTLGADHAVNMQVSYVDAAGNPAAVDGAVTWASSDTTMATIDVDASSSMIVKVTPVGPLGQVQITATADADLGAGVKSLVTVADIQIVAGEAVAGTIAPVGDPIPIG